MRLDGRTEKRRQRLLHELSEGSARGGKRELKPIEILTRVKDLLELGEPIASIRKVCGPRRSVPPTPALVEGIRRLHRAYHFPFEAYRFVGIDDETLRRAGVAKPSRAPVAEPPKRPGLRSAAVVRPVSARA